MRTQRLGPAVVLSAALCMMIQAGVAGPAVAQGKQATPGDLPVDIRSWNVANLYDGWSGEALLGEPVYGTGGQVLGAIEDLAFGRGGRLERVLVAAGGLAGDGDVVYSIPWNAAQRVSSAGIDLPVSSDNLSGHGLYPEVGDDPVGEAAFRLKDVIGDRVNADDGVFGTIRDVVLDRYDRIAALIVTPAAGAGAPGGPIAFPYNADYFEKNQAQYTSPYPRKTLRQLRPFEYDRLD